MNDLLKYLVEQREERANRLSAYNRAIEILDRAKMEVDAFGDMSGVQAEIDKLDGFIESVAQKAGVTDNAEGAADEVVATGEE